MTTSINPAHETRLLSRSNSLQAYTSHSAPGYIQANLLILPSRHAKDFHNLCTLNPIPCPLLAHSTRPGDFSAFTSCIPSIPSSALAQDLDIRTDVPYYNIYENGSPSHSKVPSIEEYWKEDHVAFLIGCSYSFDSALRTAGLTPPHMKYPRNVSMYLSNIPLTPAGIFQSSKMVVSMRMFRKHDLARVREITSKFGITHGGPVAWGWEGARRIGVQDVGKVDWGDGPLDGDGEIVVQSKEGEGEDDEYVPVFWGCGVTPQEAVMRAGKGIEGVVMGHSPGYMAVLDVRNEDILGLEPEV